MTVEQRQVSGRSRFHSNEKCLIPLALAFAAGGVWDLIAGVMYGFFIGTGRAIDSPATDPFYAVFLASFFFCFAYLQLLSALDIRRYAFVIGCLILGRVFYVLQLYGYMLLVTDFPSTFWFTGIVDLGFTVSYFILATRGGLSLRDLFLPSR